VQKNVTRCGRDRRRFEDDSEPAWNAGELECCGGELIFAVGHTEGGAPYGVTFAEMRRFSEHDARGAGWARAKRILRELIGRELGTVRDIGRVVKIGDGLSREIFAAEVELATGACDSYVVALPRRNALPDLSERTTRELRLLARLRTYSFPFHLPATVGAFPDGKHLALVRRFTPGVMLDLRAGRQGAVRPWDVVAGIAAAIHRVPGEAVADLLPGASTYEMHARTAIAVVDESDAPEMREARQWALDHLPPAHPSVLLHGDLLGQNIVLAPGTLPTVIDWEYACCGDPAYEFAIVTRGVKRPFQTADGLARLLDAYQRHGGREVKAEHVHIHELAMIARWYRTALDEGGPVAAAQELDRMRGLLRRLR
jgi:aminoglycoside phosphotransferase (APT) family kinase protein